MPTEITPSRILDEASLERACKLGRLKAPAHIHLSGVCGTGMASVLSLLKTLGFYVTGSDKAFYPPMGDVVRQRADKVYEGYLEENLTPRPALVVIGNSLTKNNPEVEFVLKHDIPFASMPEVFAGLLIGSREHCPCSIVVTGTHGKTTTTAALATLFDSAQWRPGYFIGGMPKSLPGSIRPIDTTLPPAKRVVILEGDEYDSAFFAKYAKFHSYRPDIALVTSLEFDHADIYNNVEEIGEEFSLFLTRVPQSGCILVAHAGTYLQQLVVEWRNNSQIKARIYTYGDSRPCDFQLLTRVPISGGGQLLEMKLEHLSLAVKTPLSGMQNAWNLLAVAAVGYLKGLSEQEIANGINAFTGVLRRQQMIFQSQNLCAIEDFAHHPTAVDLTLKGIREEFQGRRLIAVFEPRSNTSRRGFFQEEYTKSFSAADVVIVQEVQDAGSYTGTHSPVIPLDVRRLVSDLSIAGKTALSFSSGNDILLFLDKEIQSGDVIVLMSNGDFGGLPKKLPELLKKKNSLLFPV